jgi:hypothetical protein
VCIIAHRSELCLSANMSVQCRIVVSGEIGQLFDLLDQGSVPLALLCRRGGYPVARPVSVGASAEALHRAVSAARLAPSAR